MTTTATIPKQRERTWKLSVLGAFVDQRVTRIQERYLAELAEAVAILAKLRRGIGKDIGELPELWQVTLEDLPQQGKLGEDPTPTEQAAYTAITLYALHQQSQRERMHKPGRGLGGAVATLAKKIGNEDAVRRRFEALGTAETFSEIVHHARGLITQLRGEGIGLDYGLFADQLYWLQRPASANRVRLAWGRDYYRIKYQKDKQNDPATVGDADHGEDS